MHDIYRNIILPYKRFKMVMAILAYNLQTIYHLAWNVYYYAKSIPDKTYAIIMPRINVRHGMRVAGGMMGCEVGKCLSMLYTP